MAAFAVLAVAASAFAADDEATLRQRVQARSAAVITLLVGGIASEEANGQLKVAGQANPQQQQLIDAENADRRAIFSLIAGQFHVPVEDVAASYSKRARSKWPPHPVVAAAGYGPCKLVPAKAADATRLLIYLKQGMTYASHQQFEQALSEFQSAAAIDQNFLALHQNMGAAQVALQRLAEAESAYKMELDLVACLTPLNSTELAVFSYFIEVPEKDAGNRQQIQADKLKAEIPKIKASTYFNLACIYSLQKRKDLVLSSLRSAVDAGFKDRKALSTDPDLTFARQLPEFRELLAMVS